MAKNILSTNMAMFILSYFSLLQRAISLSTLLLSGKFHSQYPQKNATPFPALLFNLHFAPNPLDQNST